MPQDPRPRDDDLDHALFGEAPGVPGPSRREPITDLDSELFGSDDAGAAGGRGVAVGYAAPPLSRTRRILVGLGVVTVVALAVMATVAFASGSDDSPADQVRVPSGSRATSTSAVLRTPASLPIASIPPAPAPSTPPPTEDTTTATTRRRTTATEAPPQDPPATEEPTAPPDDTTPPPTDPPATEPTTPEPTTTTVGVTTGR